MPLTLKRTQGERIRIGDDITILVRRVAGGAVSLSIDAPRDVRIVRGELVVIESEGEVQSC